MKVPRPAAVADACVPRVSREERSKATVGLVITRHCHLVSYAELSNLLANPHQIRLVKVPESNGEEEPMRASTDVFKFLAPSSLSLPLSLLSSPIPLCLYNCFR